MHHDLDRNLSATFADLHARRLDRRGFLTNAARLGLAAPIAASLANLATREGQAAPRFALQDGGKTLIVAIPQATVQLDPAIG
ncbi:MAG: hypothetical protein QM692_10835, partial [Thermomicrobiales bacterium]